MKKIISILAVCLLTVSCRENDFKNKGQSTWVISTIKNQSTTSSIYYAVTTDTTDLTENSTWFADSIGAFQVGDTLIFCAKKDEKDSINK